MIPIPGLDAAKALIEPYLMIIRIVLALAAAAALWWGVHAVRSWHADAKAYAAEVACAETSNCFRRAVQAGQRGVDAVAKAREAAQEAAAVAEKERAAKAEAELERLSVAAQASAAAESTWRRRYTESLKAPACAAWSAQEVPCAISD